MSEPSIDEVDAQVEQWLHTLQSDHTRAAYRRDLVVFRTWLRASRVPARAATVAHVERFADHCLDDGASDATVRRRMAAVASFYRHMAAVWPMVNPADGVERPPTTEPAAAVVLSASDAAALWRAALELGPKTASLVGLVLFDGLKSHELLRLDVADLRPVGRELGAEVAGPRGPRSVRLDPRTAAVLRRYLGSRRDGPLLYGDNPTRVQARLTRSGVDYLVRRAVSRSGIATTVTVNVLRNTQAAPPTA